MFLFLLLVTYDKVTRALRQWNMAHGAYGFDPEKYIFWHNMLLYNIS